MSLTATEVQKAYLAYFGRPADPVGLSYWETQSSEAMYASFAASNEYVTMYSGMTNTQIVGQIYENIFGRTADSAGLIYWTNLLNSGALTIDNVVVYMLNGASGDDVTTINNRLTYCADFTAAIDTTAEILGYSGSAAATAARAALLPVTDDASLVTAEAALPTSVATVVAAGAASTGQTYTLTTSVDTLTGTIGNDTFIADNTGGAGKYTSQLADTLNGGGGNDTLKIYSDGTAAGTILPTTTGIETLYVNNIGTALNLAGSNMTGVTAVQIDAASAGFTATLAGQTLQLANDTAGTVYTVASTTDTAENITVSKLGTVAQSTVDVTGSKVTSIGLTSSGTLAANTTNNILLTNKTGVKAGTITVGGASDLTLVVGDASGAGAAGFVSTGITSIDASAATGTTSVMVASGNSATLATGAYTAAAGQTELNSAFAYKGGSGNDTLDISMTTVGGTKLTTAAAVNAMSFDGGTGTNTIVIHNTLATTAAVPVTTFNNFQNIGVRAANGTITMSNFASATGITLLGTDAGAVTVNGLASTGSINEGTSTRAAQNLAVSATGSGTSDTLAWTLGDAASATAFGGITTGTTTINGYETINLTSAGGSNTLGTGASNIALTASAGGNQTLNMILTKDLTSSGTGTLTLTGTATNINISGSGNLTYAGVVTAGTLTDTGTGAITMNGANAILNADFTSTSAAVSFKDSGATGAVALKFGNGNITTTASNFADTITVGSGTNSITGGVGADAITVAHGSLSSVDTIVYTSTGAALSGDTGTGVSANGVITGCDVITGLKAGDVINTGLTTTGLTGGATALITGTFTGMTTAADASWLIRGNYNSSTGSFTASATGTDSVLTWSDDTGGSYTTHSNSIVLVGYAGSSITNSSSLITLGA